MLLPVHHGPWRISVVFVPFFFQQRNWGCMVFSKDVSTPLFLIVAKYVMMKNNPNTEQKISLDEHLFKTLRELGLVTSRAGFSQMCGKNDSYFDCMRSRGYGVHLGTLVFLVAKISNMMEDEPDVRERARLRSAVAAINEAIHAKCRLREQELMAR